MGGGLDSRCVGRVCGADHLHRTHDLRGESQDHHPSTNSVQKTICCNLTSNAPADGRMRPKHVELKKLQYITLLHRVGISHDFRWRYVGGVEVRISQLHRRPTVKVTRQSVTLVRANDQRLFSADLVLWPLKNLSAFYNPHQFIIPLSATHHWYQSWDRPMKLSYAVVFDIYFHIILSSTLIFWKWSVAFKFSTKILYSFPVFPMRRSVSFYSSLITLPMLDGIHKYKAPVLRCDLSTLHKPQQILRDGEWIISKVRAIEGTPYLFSEILASKRSRNLKIVAFRYVVLVMVVSVESVLSAALFVQLVRPQ